MLSTRMLMFNDKPSAYTFDHISMRMLLRTTATKSVNHPLQAKAVKLYSH